MRKTIFEILERNFNYYDEVTRIEYLLSVDEFGLSLKSIIDIYFLKWEHRGTSVCVQDLYNRLGFDKISNSFDLEKYIKYCEMVVNLIFIYMPKSSYHNDKIKIAATSIFTNIRISLSKLGLEYIDDGSKRFIVVETNSFASSAAESVDPANAIRIMEYNRFIFKGNLKEKKDILKNLSDLFEGRKKELKKYNFVSLSDDIGFLINNLNIRHNNEEGKKKNKWLETVDPKVLEAWYDKTYKLILTAILSIDKVEICKEVEELKLQIEEANKVI